MSIAWLVSFCLLHLVSSSLAVSDPVTVTVIPSSLYALRGVTNNIDVLFQIKTEAAQQQVEAPVVELAVVLDVSGSMSGDLLKFAKQAINNLMSKLGPNDIVHVIAYHYHGTVIIKNGKISELENHKNLVNKLEANGGTNMMDGMELAYQILQENKKNEQELSRLQRIMVFSDGEVNVGVTSYNDIVYRIKDMSDSGIIFSSFGIGEHYNEVLMKGIAETGRGDYFYIQSAEVIPQLVDKALRGLLSVIGTDAVLKIRGTNGAIVTKIFNHNDLVAGAFIGDLRSNDLQQILCVVEYSPSQQGDRENILLWSLTYTPPNQHVAVTLKGTVRIMFTDNDALARDINPVVEAARTIHEISLSDDDVLRMMDEGRVEEAIEIKKRDLEKLEKLKEKDESGMANHFSQQTKQTLANMQSPDKSAESVKKDIHYGQYASKQASLFISDTEWKEK